MNLDLRSWRTAMLSAPALLRGIFKYRLVRASLPPYAASKSANLVVAGVILAAFVVVQQDIPASALSLKMQPLIYKDTLQKGEKKKGFVDISNPGPSKLTLISSVQAFRQIDDQGSLQFYDSPQVKAGITPDLDEFELGPHEAIRMYFLIDGTKLPSGDVFGALFVSTKPTDAPGVGESVRLGTIFALTNGTPTEHKAQITSLDVSFWQFGDNVQGSYRIKNVAKAGEATGFFPTVSIAIRPFDQRTQQEGKLIFAGRERENTFQVASSRIGFYKVSVAYGDSRQSRLVFMMTGYWRLVVLLVVVLILLSVVIVWKGRRRTRLSSERLQQR